MFPLKFKVSTAWATKSEFFPKKKPRIERKNDRKNLSQKKAMQLEAGSRIPSEKERKKRLNTISKTSRITNAYP